MSVKRLVFRDKFNVLLALLFDVIYAGCGVLASYQLSNILKGLVDGDKNLVINSLLMMIILYVLFFGFNYLFNAFVNKVRENGNDYYRSCILHNVCNMRNIDSNCYISQLTNDTKVIDDAIVTYFQMLDGVIFGFIAFIGLVCLHWGVGLVAVLSFFISLLLPKLTSKKVAENEAHRSNNVEKYTDKISDCLGGFKIWENYNSKDNMSELLDEYNDKYESERKTINDVDNKVSSFTNFMSKIIHALPDISLLVFVVLGLASPTIILAVGNMSSFFQSYVQEFIASFTKIKGINDVVKEKFSECVIEKRDVIDINGNDIELNNVTFAYDNHRVLDNLSLRFESGKKYVIVGDSGCGKSTLLNVISRRIKVNSGVVKYGDKVYDELNDYTLHNHVGYVLQSPYIFNDTVEKNISLYRDVKVDDVINFSKINEFINKDDLIEKNGDNLSGGQKQRIAIARELVSNHDVILFDEATNALDKTSNKEMIDLITSLDQTVIYVAHGFDDELLNKFDYVINMNEL